MSHSLPGQRLVADAAAPPADGAVLGPAARTHSPQAGLRRVAMFDALATARSRRSGSSAPTPPPACRICKASARALEKAELVDRAGRLSPDRDDAFAHVLLPAARQSRADGHVLQQRAPRDADGAGRRRRRAMRKPDWWWVQQVGAGDGLRARGMKFDSAAEIFDEFARVDRGAPERPERTAPRACSASAARSSGPIRRWAHSPARRYADGVFPTPSGRRGCLPDRTFRPNERA